MVPFCNLFMERPSYFSRVKRPFSPDCSRYSQFYKVHLLSDPHCSFRRMQKKYVQISTSQHTWYTGKILTSSLLYSLIYCLRNSNQPTPHTAVSQPPTQLSQLDTKLHRATNKWEKSVYNLPYQTCTLFWRCGNNPPQVIRHPGLPKSQFQIHAKLSVHHIHYRKHQFTSQPIIVYISSSPTISYNENEITETFHSRELSFPGTKQ